MVGEDRFDPRLRLDLSSGKGSLRGLTDSIDRLNKSENIQMLPPRPPYVDPDAPPGVDYERAIGLVHGRHTQDMHDRHAAMLRKICQQNAGGVHTHIDSTHTAHQLYSHCTPPPRTTLLICHHYYRHYRHYQASSCMTSARSRRC